MMEEDPIHIQNILNGSQEAQKHLYEKYKIIVENYIKFKYSKYNDFDDDVSEILIKVFFNLKSFNENKSKFKSWVINVANNHMIDKWRNNTLSLTFSNRKNTQTLSEDINNLKSSFVSINQTTKAIDFENSDSVNFLFTQISKSDHKLLDMKYIQGYSYEEIGKEFNLTSSTISNKINYIKSKLKKNNKNIILD